MRILLLFLLCSFNVILFGLAIYLHYFKNVNDVYLLVAGGIAMLVFVTAPATAEILSQIHEEKTADE
jgi:multisubunit Na+/H+ antiporter MnhG subunit